MISEERKARMREYAKRTRAEKRAEKVAAMSPERRAQYEHNLAARGPGLARARAIRDAKGPEWATAMAKKAGIARQAARRAESQDKPNQNNMANAETVPNPATVIPITSPALVVVADPPVNGGHHPETVHTNSDVRGYTAWDAEEREKVAVGTAMRLRAQGLRHAPQEGDREGNRFLLDAVRAAQHEVLEKHRRRYLNGRSALGKKFFRDLDIALTAKTDSEALVKKLEAQAVLAPVPAPVVIQAPAMTDDQIITEGLAKASLAQLMQTTMAKMFETLGQHEAKANDLHDFINLQMEENALVKRELAAMQVEITNLRTTAKIKLPVVAIVGCMPHLYHHIIEGAKETGIHCDFRHYEQGSKARPFTADYAIVLHWVGHDWDDQVHNAVPDRSRAKFIGTGGVGMAIKQLKEWFQHE